MSGNASLSIATMTRSEARSASVTGVLSSFWVHLERVGIDPHDRLAAGQRGAQRNFEQRVHVAPSGCFRGVGVARARATGARGVSGMSRWSMPSSATRVDDGVDQRRRRADRAGLAGALDAERVGAARHDIVARIRSAAGRRRAAPRSRSDCRSAAARSRDRRRVRSSIAWPTPCAIAAMHLAGQQQRVDDGAEIVDHEIAHDLDHAPVSGSISTSQTWQPFGKVGCGGVKWPLSAKPGSRPGGSCAGVEGGARHRVDA